MKFRYENQLVRVVFSFVEALFMTAELFWRCFGSIVGSRKLGRDKFEQAVDAN